MVKAENYQIEYIDLSGDDKVTVSGGKESRAFCTFFAPRVSKIQVVAKMHKMHTIQNERQRMRAFCTFFAHRVSKIQVVAKMHKMHTIQNKRQRKRAFSPFSLFNSTNGKQNQT